MYDILQLNDMLVPELLDIAEQQDISNAKKLEKQELIYQILDKQTSMSTEKKEIEVEKTKRKRMAKPVVENSSSEITETEVSPKETRLKKVDDKKRVTRKPKEEESEKEEKYAVEKEKNSK